MFGLVVVLFTFPLIALLGYTLLQPTHHVHLPPDWWPSLVFTFNQAFLSSLASLIIGFLGGWGLKGWRNHSPHHLPHDHSPQHLPHHLPHDHSPQHLPHHPSRDHSPQHLPRDHSPRDHSSHKGPQRGRPWRGGLRMSPYSRTFIEAFLLLPSFVPSLLILVGVLRGVSWLGTFPFGLWGVVLVHTLLNVGLVSVVVGRLLDRKLTPLEPLAFIEGASFFHVLKTILQLIWRDLLLLQLFVFSVCVSSFTVALVASGGLQHTLEVLMFYKLKQNQLGPALALGFLQMVLLAFVALGVSNYKTTAYAGASRSTSPLPPLFYKRSWLGLPVLCSLFVMLGFFSPQLYKGFELFHNPYLRQSLGPAFVNSLLISLVVGGGLVVGLLLLMALMVVRPAQYQWVRRFLLAYSLPSAVLMGFGFWLLFDESLVITAFGLVLIFFPFVYRLMGDSILKQSQREVQMARIMGASCWPIVLQILAPRQGRGLCFCAGLAAFWAVGDFAFSSVVLGESKTLALVTYDLLRSYHLNQSMVLVWLCCLLALCVWFLFLSCAYAYKKLLFKIQEL